MAASASLILSLTLTLVQGEYDTQALEAEKAIPSKLKSMRDAFIPDSGIYQEIMFHALSYFLPTDSDNPLCNNHSILYHEAVLEDQLWAIKMMDASSKMGDGILKGNIQSLGSYDECLEVQGPDQLFTGQLCVVLTHGVLLPGISNSDTSQFSLMQALPTDLTLTVCVPSSCSAADVQTHWHGVLSEVNASASVNPVDCSVRGDMEPGLHTWVALGVLAVLLTLILASSCYECYVHHQPTKEKRILVCFSVFVNLRKLVQSERHVDSLNVLDGLRFLAISWIVLGHRYHQCLQVPNLFLTYTEKYITAWFMSPVFNTMMAVELFFLLSGCLVTYHFLKERANGVKFNLFYFYYKRYVRLTPALATVMLLEGCLMYYASDGPLWKRLVGNRMDTCVDYWWTNLLYISNYVNPYRICVVQSWYLSADMQLYVLSPLLLLPLSRPGRRGLLLLAGCYLATTAAAFSNAFYNQLPAGGTATIDKKTEQNHGLEYVKTHVRAASWLTGVALGYILHMYRTSDHPWKMTKVTSAAAWTVSTLLCVTAVFSLAPFQQISYQYSPLRDSLYIALHRNCFSLGAAGVIFLCACGKGGFFNKFLGWGGFRPLATLSYGVYLCHMGLQMISLARIRQPYPFDMYSLFTDFLSDLVLANLMAALLYIGVEAPSWEVGRWFYNTRTAAKTATEKPCQSSINLDEERTVL